MTKISARERITDTIIRNLESGNVPAWSKPWRTMASTCGHIDGAFPKNHDTGRDYSGVNIILLWMAKEEFGYSRNRWMTFKQAKAKGGMVRKGEHGTTICYAGRYEKEGNMLDSDGQPIKEERRFLKTYTVFNLDQIDGLDLAPVTNPVPAPVARPHNEFDDMIEALCVNLRHGGDRAFYRRAPIDMIQMPFASQFVDHDSYTSTLAHELTHWTGAKSRLNRTFGKRFGDKDYAFEELVAELGAAFICAEYQIDHTSQTTAYLASWLKGMKDNPQMIISAASLASKAVDFIRQEVLAAREPEAIPPRVTIPAPGAPVPAMALDQMMADAVQAELAV